MPGLVAESKSWGDCVEMNRWEVLRGSPWVVVALVVMAGAR